jgi:hypothetical protein
MRVCGYAGMRYAVCGIHNRGMGIGMGSKGSRVCRYIGTCIGRYRVVWHMA